GEQVQLSQYALRQGERRLLANMLHRTEEEHFVTDQRSAQRAAILLATQGSLVNSLLLGEVILCRKTGATRKEKPCSGDSVATRFRDDGQRCAIGSTFGS